jgi:hypothetical protein
MEFNEQFVTNEIQRVPEYTDVDDGDSLYIEELEEVAECPECEGPVIDRYSGKIKQNTLHFCSEDCFEDYKETS